ncbi:MAG TPA: hypothetical protein VKW04_17475, partial [Planctomycetota bacterium]|nr:hypothetical protein [Planctomycetota bacterium]
MLMEKDPRASGDQGPRTPARAAPAVLGHLRTGRARLFRVHREKLFNREIQGLVRYGIDLEEKDRRKLASLEREAPGSSAYFVPPEVDVVG